MKTHQQPKEKRPALLPLCMILCIVIIAVSLFLAYRPLTPEDILHRADTACTYLSQHLTSLTKTMASSTDASDSQTSADTAVPDPEEETIPYMESTGESGDISSLQAEYNDPADQVYLYMLDTSMGPMLYYHQADIRWADFLYGGHDPMSTYGCGPTAVAMVVNSFGNASVDPTDMARWASDNGYYALHSGSYHSLIPDALEAYGLHAESVTDRSYEHVAELLSSGHILVALMGRGALTQNGHFVVFTQLLEDGKVSIADPVNYENCTLEWDLVQLLSELKKSYDSGGPLWAVGI